MPKKSRPRFRRNDYDEDSDDAGGIDPADLNSAGDGPYGSVNIDGELFHDPTDGTLETFRERSVVRNQEGICIALFDQENRVDTDIECAGALNSRKTAMITTKGEILKWQHERDRGDYDRRYESIGRLVLLPFENKHRLGQLDALFAWARDPDNCTLDRYDDDEDNKRPGPSKPARLAQARQSCEWLAQIYLKGTSTSALSIDGVSTLPLIDRPQRVIVNHSGASDEAYLRDVLKVDLRQIDHIADTSHIAEYLGVEVKTGDQISLGNLARKYGCKVQLAHNAANDAHWGPFLLLRLLQKYITERLCLPFDVEWATVQLVLIGYDNSEWITYRHPNKKVMMDEYGKAMSAMTEVGVAWLDVSRLPSSFPPTISQVEKVQHDDHLITLGLQHKYDDFTDKKMMEREMARHRQDNGETGSLNKLSKTVGRISQAMVVAHRTRARFLYGDPLPKDTQRFGERQNSRLLSVQGMSDFLNARLDQLPGADLVSLLGQPESDGRDVHVPLEVTSDGRIDEGDVHIPLPADISTPRVSTPQSQLSPALTTPVPIVPAVNSPPSTCESHSPQHFDHARSPTPALIMPELSRPTYITYESERRSPTPPAKDTPVRSAHDDPAPYAQSPLPQDPPHLGMGSDHGYQSHDMPDARPYTPYYVGGSQLQNQSPHGFNDSRYADQSDVGGGFPSRPQYTNSNLEYADRYRDGGGSQSQPPPMFDNSGYASQSGMSGGFQTHPQYMLNHAGYANQYGMGGGFQGQPQYMSNHARYTNQYGNGGSFQDRSQYVSNYSGYTNQYGSGGTFQDQQQYTPYRAAPSSGVANQNMSSTSCPTGHRTKKDICHSTHTKRQICGDCGQGMKYVFRCSTCQQQWCARCYDQVTNRAHSSRKTKARRQPPKRVRDERDHNVALFAASLQGRAKVVFEELTKREQNAVVDARNHDSNFDVIAHLKKTGRLH
ncbi:hypothetical protein LTR86_000810 [Recurvomyces mirabilis]|nr:hypothetical protein LTR86_000810 [Recurvomyces mirabilis]